DIGDDLLRDVEVAYVSGITPALSPSCRDATEHFMASARSAGATVVFDINYRSKLWDPERAAAVLAALAS
ncbi:MAG: sugar kinase, partial [Actinobacteria bacterium]|nr:sugar kinase [Actinomycetota bacterium]